MHIVVVGLSHRTAPVEVREKLSIPDQSITESLEALKAFSDVLEVSILSTCNRLEIYALVKDKNTGISSIKEFIADYSGSRGLGDVYKRQIFLSKAKKMWI